MGTYQEINLVEELKIFRSFSSTSSEYIKIEDSGPDIICLKPVGSDDIKKPKVGFLALIHGNETVGLPLINSLVQSILSGDVKISSPTYFALGNIPAALANKRFIEKDLNRCFGLTLFETYEDRRARELEKNMLNQIDILLDLHQTVYASEAPFFIFQYSSPKCFQYLRMMNEKIPTVLQFDNIGEDQGLSTDEYLRSLGGFGTALELGQVGYLERFFRVGADCCLRLLNSIRSADLSDKKTDSVLNLDCKFFEISGRFYAQEDNTVLDSKYFNFSDFKSGDVIGSANNNLIRADRSGKMLFPKLNQSLMKGQNLFFICNEINHQKLIEIQGNSAEFSSNYSESKIHLKKSMNLQF